MGVVDGWVMNRNVRLHYLDSQRDADPALMPLVCVPGQFGAAEDYTNEISSFLPRRCIALSLRGRGKSDAPAQGYSFEDHVTDLETVLSHLGLEQLYLMGYSVGVPCALGYAIRHPQVVRGLIVGDYPARYPAVSADWAQRVAAELPSSRAKPQVIEGIQRESREVFLWDDLPVIRYPVLIMRGGQANTLLTEAMAELYRQRLVQAHVVTLEDAGHELWKPDYDKYIQTVRDFLASIDQAGSATPSPLR